MEEENNKSVKICNEMSHPKANKIALALAKKAYLWEVRGVYENWGNTSVPHYHQLA